MTKNQFAGRFGAERINAEAGVIYGVSLCSVGPALGHGVMCDRITLEQLLQCARQYSGGLKVKMTHAGDAGDIVGALKELRIEGDKLRGDLHLLSNYEKRAYVLEIAEKIPDTFGLSVAFSGPAEERGGLSYARCTEIYSCDLVSEPAANRDGLFAAKPEGVDAPGGGNLSPMTDAEIKALVTAAVDTKFTEFAGRVKAVEDSLKNFAAGAAVETVKTELAALKGELTTARTEFSTKLGDDAKRMELAAQIVAKEFAGKLGLSKVPADGGGTGGNGGGGGCEPTGAQKFIELANAKFKETKSKASALQQAITEAPALYKEFRAANQQIKWAV